MSDYIQWIRSKVGHEPVILVGVCVVISNENSEILLQRRSDNGAWCLPGGHMEVGETAKATVEREVREEMSIDVAVKDFVGVYTNRKIITYASGDQSFPIGIFFTGSIQGTPAPNHEVLEVKYFAKESLPEKLLEVHKQPIQDFFDGKRGLIR